MTIHLIYFLVFLHQRVLSKYVESSMTYVGGSIYSQVGIGTPPLAITSRICLLSKYSHISSNAYHYLSSKTAKILDEKIILIEDTLIKAIQMSDRIKIYGHPYGEFNYSFYLYKSELSNKADCLALGYKKESEEFSLVHQLKKKELINELSFTLLNMTKIIYGELPLDIKRNLSLVSKCDVNPNIPFWNCKLNAILIENEKIEIEDFIFFQSTQKTVFVPKHFIDLLKQTIFNEYIKKEICSENEIYNSISSFMIRCNCSAIEKFPSISFLIGNYKFELNKEQLFEYSIKDKCFFNLRESTYSDKKWIVGTSFYSQYTTTFNYENNSISFFDYNKSKPQSEIHNCTNIQKIYKITIILTSFSIYFLCYIKKYKVKV